MSSLTPAEKQALYEEAFRLLERAQQLLDESFERCNKRMMELGYDPVPKYSECSKV